MPPQMLLIIDASKTISCLHMLLHYVGSASWMCFKKKMGERGIIVPDSWDLSKWRLEDKRPWVGGAVCYPLKLSSY